LLDSKANKLQRLKAINRRKKGESYRSGDQINQSAVMSHYQATFMLMVDMDNESLLVTRNVKHASRTDHRVRQQHSHASSRQSRKQASSHEEEYLNNYDGIIP
jgi:6-phosphogluconolactonase (cycloisomerase 2 family)